VSVLYWFANSESPYLAGCCGGPGVITRTLGLTNVFDDAAEDWPQISWETVAQRDPDVLILGDLTRRSQTAETAAAKIAFLEGNPLTREMTAVKNKRYVALAGAELNPSIRIVDAMEKVVDGLREYGLRS
jgi:iron complex transport system substrate-binding protein